LDEDGKFIPYSVKNFLVFRLMECAFAILFSIYATYILSVSLYSP
jgi:hypothetical protein